MVSSFFSACPLCENAVCFLFPRLTVIAQRGEISLADKTKKETSPPTPKPKKAQRIKALSPKLQRDEQLEVIDFVVVVVVVV
jgi:hypothetical protein